jgi:RNA polymerase sigma factor (sigma-70 family)
MAGPAGDGDASTTAGDRLERLYEAHYWPMVRLAGLLLDADEAEDVVQDVFVSVHRRGGDVLRDPAAAQAYLRRAVVNVCRSAIRRRMAVRRRQRALEASAWVGRVDQPSSEAIVVVSAEQRELLALVAALPRRQRECLVLRYWADLTDREVAEALGVSVGSVKQHLSRATATLRAGRDRAALGPRATVEEVER